MSEIDDLKREVRTLRWQNKQLGKQSGKQGQRIFELRNENDALRAAAPVTIGDYRRLLEQKRAAERENAILREKLAAAEAPPQ